MTTTCPSSLFLMALALLSAAIMPCCHGKVINTDASSSWIHRRAVGIAQSWDWLHGIFLSSSTTTTGGREPRQVQLALVGLGRTGSTSFSAALKELGYAPIHDDESPEVMDIYHDMMTGNLRMDLVNDALGERGFDAPMITTHNYVKWAATAPNVKVILTIRDPHKWAESWLTILPLAFLLEQRPFQWLKIIQDGQEFVRETMLNVPTNGHPDKYNDIPTLVAGFQAWTDFVQATVPPDRLLVFDVRQGWEPLCEFLGKDVPANPFPHINDRVVVDTIIKCFQIITWIWPLLIALPVIVAGYFLYWFYSKFKSTTKTSNNNGTSAHKKRQ